MKVSQRDKVDKIDILVHCGIIVWILIIIVTPILKLCNIINFSWWIVLSPLIIIMIVGGLITLKDVGW